MQNLHFNIRDCHFSSIILQNSVILKINGSNIEKVKAEFCTFSDSYCYRLAVVRSVSNSNIFSVCFNNNEADITWQLYNSTQIKYLSEVRSNIRTSSGVSGINRNYFSHSNFSHITSYQIRSTIAFEYSKDEISNYILIDTCKDQPLVSFFKIIAPISLSNFIMTKGKVSGSLFIFEHPQAIVTATISDSIFLDIENVNSICGSSKCQVTFLNCRSNIGLISNQNADLSFEIKRGALFCQFDCLTLKPKNTKLTITSFSLVQLVENKI